MGQHTLNFEEATHAYTLDGRPISSVTQILDAVFGNPWDAVPPKQREYALRLGREVHKWTAYVDEGGADRPQGAQMSGYLEAWNKFKLERLFLPQHIEEPLYSLKLFYAGTQDRVGMAGKLETAHHKRILLDIKTGGELHPFAALQTMAYKIAWEERHYPFKISERWGVRLGSDGRFHAEQYTNKSDRNVWLAALTVLGWRAAHNITSLVEV